MSELGFTEIADTDPPLSVQRPELIASVAVSAARLFNGFFECLEVWRYFLAGSAGRRDAAV